MYQSVSYLENWLDGADVSHCEWRIMQSMTELIMIYEILSIFFQMLNAMPTETRLQYQQDEQELVQKAVQSDMYKL